MAATTDHTPAELSQITTFAAGLIQTGREALDMGLGDDSSWDMLIGYAYHAAPHFISVAEMRSMCESASKLVIDEARAAGHPSVL